MKGLACLVAAAIAVTAVPAGAVDNICPYEGQDQERIARVMRIPYENVPKLVAFFCDKVGKKAYNALGPDRVRDTYLGPIIGVAWVNSGDTISEPDAPLRLAPISAFWYIIGPGGVSDRSFVRIATDIVGR
jgi:hypothetical protein